MRASSGVRAILNPVVARISLHNVMQSCVIFLHNVIGEIVDDAFYERAVVVATPRDPSYPSRQLYPSSQVSISRRHERGPQDYVLQRRRNVRASAHPPNPKKYPSERTRSHPERELTPARPRSLTRVAACSVSASPCSRLSARTDGSTKKSCSPIGRRRSPPPR